MDTDQLDDDGGMAAANTAICEAIAKAADLIAQGKNILLTRAALGAAHVVFQRQRGKITQFQTEAHLESLQQLITITNMLPIRPQAQDRL